MAKLTTKIRQALPATAKARATQQFAAGGLLASQRAEIDVAANRVLKK